MEPTPKWAFRAAAPKAIIVVMLAVATVSACGSTGSASGSGSTSVAPGTASTVASTTTRVKPPSFPDSPRFPPLGETDHPVRLTLTSAVEGTASTAPRFGPARPSKDTGPVKLTGSAAPGVHVISRTPPSASSGPSRDVYPHGSTGTTNGGELWGVVENGDGSTDFYYRDGSHSHVSPPPAGGAPSGPGGSVDVYDGDGHHVHIGPEGAYQEDKEGNVSPYDPDRPEDAEFDHLPIPGDDPSDGADDPSGGAGEPHYLSEDGLAITSQSLGEFVLTTGVAGQTVQARTEPWLESKVAAAVTAYAFGVGEHEVVVHLDGTVVVDDEAMPAGKELQYGLTGGGAVGTWRDDADGPVRDAVVVWPDLSVARVSVHRGYLNLDLRWNDSTGTRKGVLGSDDGRAANDRTARDGTAMDEAHTEDFVRSWQVTDGSSLFDYAAGESVATFVRDDFPEAAEPGDDDAGAKACARVPEGFARDACVYDVGLTGDDGFVEAYEQFGAQLVAVELRRNAAVALKGLRTTGSGGGTTTTRPTGGIELTAAERDGAQRVASDADLKASVGAGASKVYSFPVDGPSKIAAFSNALDCPNRPYVAGQAGYAFFGADLAPLGGPRLACDDSPSKGTVPAGTYYVKFVGPGTVDISLEVADA